MSEFLSVKVFLILSLFGVYAKAQDCSGDCGENAFCNPCGDVCEKFCSDTHGKPCPRICLSPACQCEDNFIRDDVTKKCVLKEECSKSN